MFMVLNSLLVNLGSLVSFCLRWLGLSTAHKVVGEKQRWVILQYSST